MIIKNVKFDCYLFSFNVSGGFKCCILRYFYVSVRKILYFPLHHCTALTAADRFIWQIYKTSCSIVRDEMFP